MKALVLLSHGSRLPESNQEVEKLADHLAGFDDNPFYAVACAFQQFASPSFGKVVDDLVGRQINDIVVMPLFLASGSHVRTDLPELIRAATDRYPDVKLSVTPHLGGIKGFARFLLESALGENQPLGRTSPPP